MRVPSAYRFGYRRAIPIDLDTAQNYIAHTTVGDPVMDAIAAELATVPREQVHEFIQAGMQEDRDGLKHAPQLLRDFFTDPPSDPDWFDDDAFRPGIRAFQRNAGRILTAFVTGVLVDGFSTLISKSFAQTGRIFDNGVWRLKQNNRHQLEIFIPGGLKRYGDGWKLSVRIRFIHAQMRRLLGESSEWDHNAWGVPISAAHVGYAIACFATRTVRHSMSLGARYDQEERTGFHDVWRYTGYLMGLPESILFNDERHAQQIYRIGTICEPPPTQEAIIMANALINSAPLVAGVENTEERRRLVTKVIYPVSRALIGTRLASQLRFPRRWIPFTLLWYRLDQFLKGLIARLRKKAPTDFPTLLIVSAYNASGISYRLPDHVHDEEGSEW